jgi:hypothetical protein
MSVDRFDTKRASSPTSSIATAAGVIAMNDADPDGLRPGEVDRLLDVVRELAHERKPEGHLYATVPPRKAACAFVAALEEHPYLTLRQLIFALEEAGHAAVMSRRQAGDFDE